MNTMASNFIADVEEEVTCPVCLDLFSDPYQLPCLHILCLRCSDQIALNSHQGIVTCPVCRANTRQHGLKKDFRTARLVEKYRKEQELQVRRQSHSESYTVTCDQCNNMESTAACRRCNTCLCARCVSIHCDQYGCLVKDVQELSSAVQTCRAEITMGKQQLQHHKHELQRKFELSKSRIQEEQRKRVKEIQMYFEMVMKHCNTVQQQVHTLASKVECNNQELYEVSVAALDSYLESLSDMEKSADRTLIHSCGLILMDLYTKLDGLSTCFKDIHLKMINTTFKTDDCINLTIEDASNVDGSSSESLSNRCEIAQSLNVQVHTPTAVRFSSETPPVSTESKLSLQSILTTTMIRKQTVQLPSFVHKMIEENGQLLCLTQQSLEVYNVCDGTHMGSLFPTSGLKNVTGMSLTSYGQLLITSTVQGLINYDRSLGSLTCISEGRYWDVTNNGRDSIALQVKQNMVYVDTYNSNLQRTAHTKTKLAISGRISCAVSSRSLYVCSTSDNCIWMVDTNSGSTLRTLRPAGLLLNSPLICGSEQSELLVCNQQNGLHVVDSKTETFQPICIDIKKSIAAALGKHTLFVVEQLPFYESFNLCMYILQ